MTSNWEENFAEENNRIRERMKTSPFEQIQEALYDLGRKTAAAVNDEPDRVSVSRRVAKWILYAAVDMGKSIEECEALLDQVSRLGFDRPQDRVTTVAVFARYCLRSGRKQDGYKYFLPAMVELENASGVIQSAPPELVEGYRRLLSQLASSQETP